MDKFDSKEEKQQRKQRSQKNPQTHKKTNLKAKQAHSSALHEKLKTQYSIGQVIKIGLRFVDIFYDEKVYSCSLLGKLFYQKQKLVIGDKVFFDPEEGKLFEVLPRQSILQRTDLRKPKLIAANIDLVLITASCVSPPFKPHLIDRFLIAAMKGNLEPVILIHKIDLLEKDPKEKAKVGAFQKLYTSLGYHVLLTSIKQPESLELLAQTMAHRSSVFSGQSGVGKSALINRLTSSKLKEGSLSSTQHGKHTTTQACLIPLKQKGLCIDTPGIRSFGIKDLTFEDLKAHFFEITEIGQDCRFHNCRHTHEVQCAVKQAVEDHKIDPLRFASYQKLLTEITKPYEGGRLF